MFYWEKKSNGGIHFRNKALKILPILKEFFGIVIYLAVKQYSIQAM